MKATHVKSLEKKVFAQIKQYNLQNKPFLLCVSGGKDSLVLLNVFLNLRDKFNINFKVLHVVHDSSNAFINQKKNSQQNFRYKTYISILKLSQKYHFTFLSNVDEITKIISPSMEIKNPSEESFRSFRYSCVSRYKKWDDIVTLGHHLDDLLETRILRLTRGTGIQGLVSMKVWDGQMFRPFLTTPAVEITAYQLENKIKFFEDPSNKKTKFLRNWVRNKWLKDLEKKVPGSKLALARSLEQVSEAFCKQPLSYLDAVMPQGVSRQKLLILSYEQKMQVFATYLGQLKRSGYTRAHIEEILKRLDTSQKVLTFKTAGLHWDIDAEFIKARLSDSAL